MIRPPPQPSARPFLALLLFLLSGFWFPTPSHAQDYTSNLVGWWKLDESSGTSAADSAGSNTGTLTNGPVWQPIGGKASGALDFEESSEQYISLGNPAALQITGSLTIAAWIKPESHHGGSADDYVVSKHNYGGSCGYALKGSEDCGSQRIQLVINSASNCSAQAQLCGSTILSNNTWYHVAGVYNATAQTMSIYVNGVLDNGNLIEGSVPASIFNSTANALIGTDYSSGVASTYDDFDGLIDDVRIYNRALSAADVAALYAATRSDCSNPSGVAGDIIYSGQYRVPRYCNGSLWVSMGPEQYVPTAVTFDGTNDYLTYASNFTGVADGKTVTGAVWFRRNGGVGSAQTIFSSNDSATANTTNRRFEILLNTSNKIQIVAQSSTPATVLDAATAATFTDNNWHQLLFSIDLTNSSNRAIYIDGVADSATWTTYTNTNIDFSMATPRNAVGSWVDGTRKFNGDLADLWLDIGNYTDLSSSTNRAKFITAAGRPVNPGATGDNPAGITPDVFLSGAAASWHTNDGAGGGFTLNGALTTVTGPGAPGDTTTGLVGWWKFDEGTGTTAADSSGNGNDLTFSGSPAWITGQRGGALDFATTDNARKTNPSSALTITGSVTVSSWIKLDAYPAAYDNIINVTNGINNWERIVVNTNGDLWFSCGTGGDMYHSAGTLSSLGTWYHITGVYDSALQKARVYLNGVLVTTDNETCAGGYPSPPATQFNVGNTYFDAKIDDVRIYNRALTATDVAALYAGSVTGTCASPSGTEADILYNGNFHVPQYCDGSNWVAIGPIPGAGGGGCSSPTGTESDLVYNAASRVIQYCDGTKWVRAGLTPLAPTEGLIHYWKFDESSGTTAADSAGSTNGTLANGPVWQPTGGKVGGALSFDDNDDIVQLVSNAPGVLAGMTQLTLAAWVKGNNLGVSGNHDMIYSEVNAGNCGDTYFGTEIYEGNTGDPEFGITTSTQAGYPSQAYETFSSNTWYHVVSVYDSVTDVHKTYVNGQLEDSHSLAASALPSSNASSSIGNDVNVCNTAGFNGLIDDVRIYNRVLSASEVQSLYYATGGN
jgi:hypothetical protein